MTYDFMNDATKCPLFFGQFHRVCRFATLFAFSPFHPLWDLAEFFHSFHLAMNGPNVNPQ
jgi:hypothetical protein